MEIQIKDKRTGDTFSYNDWKSIALFFMVYYQSGEFFEVKEMLPT